ncbi:hypothetical protein ACHAPT_001135 [Fusarium lateritium]
MATAPEPQAHIRVSFWTSTLKPWIWEIVTWLVAAGLLVAICVILDHANGKPVNDWDLPINLNSLVATLSTLYRALVVTIAAEILSQEKWIWFWSTSSPPRPLLHLQLFDAGSRGIWGAVRLLPIVLRRSVPAVLAVLVVIASFAIGPFTQQALNTVDQDGATGVNTAKIPIARSITGYDTYYRTLVGGLLGFFDFNYDTRGDFYSTLTPSQSSQSAVGASCLTGNCTFPSWGPIKGADSDLDVTHASAGVCNTCFDVSSLVKKWNNESTLHLALPNDMELIYFDSQPHMLLKGGNLSWAEPVLPRAEAAKYRWAFANITVLTMTANGKKDWHPTNYTAVSCSLYPCLRSYWGAVTRGASKEEAIHSKPMYPDLGNYTGKDMERYVSSVPLPGQGVFWAAVQDPCRINDTIYTASNMSKAANSTAVRLFDPENAPDYPSVKVPEECVYRFHNFFAILTQLLFETELFNGTCGWDSRQGQEADCGDKWWQTRFWNRGNASADSITKTFDSITNEMTNKFRLGLGRENGTADHASGVVHETLAYTIIKWQWITLPALLLGIETVILGWMVIRSWIYRHQEMAWKSSVLPLLYYRDRFSGMDGSRMEKKYDLSEGDAADGCLMTAEEMEKDAGRVRVRFVRGLRQDDDE